MRDHLLARFAGAKRLRNPARNSTHYPRPKDGVNLTLIISVIPNPPVPGVNVAVQRLFSGNVRRVRFAKRSCSSGRHARLQTREVPRRRHVPPDLIYEHAPAYII